MDVPSAESISPAIDKTIAVALITRAARLLEDPCRRRALDQALVLQDPEAVAEIQRMRFSDYAVHSRRRTRPGPASPVRRRGTRGGVPALPPVGPHVEAARAALDDRAEVLAKEPA